MTELPTPDATKASNMLKRFITWYSKYNKLNLDVMWPGLSAAALLGIYNGAFGAVPFWFLCGALSTVFAFIVYFIVKDNDEHTVTIDNLSGIGMAVGMIVFTHDYGFTILVFFATSIAIIIFTQLCEALK